MTYGATERATADYTGQNKHDEKPIRKRRKLFPPAWVLSIVVAFVVCILWIRIGNPVGDHAAVNLLTFLCCFLAFSVVALWFMFLSGYRLLTRLLVFAAGFGMLMWARAMFTVDQVSGELVPSFKLRWAQSADERLTIPVAESSGPIDLATTGVYDFPQFLGPQRNLRLEGFRLNPDWKSQPPKLVWRQPIGAGWSSFAAVNGYAVTLEQRGELELVTCYEIRTGDPIWTHGTKTRHSTTMGGVGPRSTPTVHDGRVYTLGATGTFLCLDGATGKVLWEKDFLKQFGVTPAEDATAVAWGRSNSPLIVDDTVVVPVGGAKNGPHVSLVAFDQVTGERIWEAGDRQVSYASPILVTVAGRRQILSVNEDNITGHDPNTGETLWSQKWPGKSYTEANVSQPVALKDDRFLLSKAYGTGAAVFQVEPSADGFRVQEVWRETRLLKTKFTNVVAFGDFVYGLSDGILECVEPATGQRKWKRGRYGHGQLLCVEGVLLIQAESGDVALVNASPDRFEELASFPALDGKTWNNPCLYGSYLLVRNAEEAACYELLIEDSEPNRHPESAPHSPHIKKAAMKDPDFDNSGHERRRSPMLLTCLGCGVVAVLGFFVLSAGAGALLYWGLGKMDQFATRFEEQGYERVSGQVVTVNKPVDSPRVYTAQVLKVTSDVDADLAVMAQVFEIHATVNGNIDFMGQVLVVKPGGVVKGDIRVEAAQVIDVQGVVEGEVTGSYQVLKRNQNGRLPESADAGAVVVEEEGEEVGTTEDAPEEAGEQADATEAAAESPAPKQS